MTGSVDERVTTLIGHLTEKFRELDAAVARPTPMMALGMRVAELE